jgi:hypothetical protein
VKTINATKLWSFLQFPLLQLKKCSSLWPLDYVFTVKNILSFRILWPKFILRITKMVAELCHKPKRSGFESRWSHSSNSSSRALTLGFTQPLIEMSTKNLSGGKARPARKAETLPPSVSRLYRKCGVLDVSSPIGIYGLLQKYNYFFTYMFLVHYCPDYFWKYLLHHLKIPYNLYSSTLKVPNATAIKIQNRNMSM